VPRLGFNGTYKRKIAKVKSHTYLQFELANATLKIEKEFVLQTINSELTAENLKVPITGEILTKYMEKGREINDE
jgi:hypothetical protein